MRTMPDVISYNTEDSGMSERPLARQPLRLAIPGGRPLVLTHGLLDFNGTLALDGKLIADIATLLRELSRQAHCATRIF